MAIVEDLEYKKTTRKSGFHFTKFCRKETVYPSLAESKEKLNSFFFLIG